MTRVDEIIERAKDGLPESEVAILAREVLKTREEVASLQRFRVAFEEHMEKTEYIQRDERGLFRGMLGMHRDDAARLVIDRLLEELRRAQRTKGEAEGRAALADRRALGMKPHVFAAMVNSVRDLARQYGQMEQFRCRVADLLGTYIHVEHGSKGAPKQDGVVVPCNPREWNAMQAVIAASEYLLACDPAEATATAIMECRRDLSFALRNLETLRAQSPQETTT